MFQRYSTLCAVLLTLAVGGCGSSEAADSAATAEVDSRFSSAQNLLEYFNQLNTQMPADARSIIPLYYLENDFQGKQHQLYARDANSLHHDFERAFYAKYGESFTDYYRRQRKKHPLKPCTPAVLTKVEARRAEGSYKDNEGETRPLYLVEFDHRWWLSGYTLEYRIDPELREMMKEVFDEVSKWNESSSEYLRPVLDGVKNGSYSTASAAREAYMEAVIAEVRERRNR
jgi:hypothetical protein